MYVSVDICTCSRATAASGFRRLDTQSGVHFTKGCAGGLVSAGAGDLDCVADFGLLRTNLPELLSAVGMSSRLTTFSEGSGLDISILEFLGLPLNESFLLLGATPIGSIFCMDSTPGTSMSNAQTACLICGMNSAKGICLDTLHFHKVSLPFKCGLPTGVLCIYTFPRVSSSERSCFSSAAGVGMKSFKVSGPGLGAALATGLLYTICSTFSCMASGRITTLSLIDLAL